jgi:hypothetical protein
MTGMRRILLLVLLLRFSLIAGAQPAQAVPSFAFYRSGKIVFTNKDLAAGKILFFFFFDPTCEHCQRAMTNLGRQFKSYKRAAVYLISLSDHQTMRSFIGKYAPGLRDQKNVTLLQDAKNEFIYRFRPVHYPAMFLYSPKGILLDYEDNENSMFRFLKYL